MILCAVPPRPRPPLWESVSSRELAALAGSITEGLSKPIWKSTHARKAKVRAWTANPLCPKGRQLSLAPAQLLLPSIQPPTPCITAAFWCLLLQTHTCYPQEAPERIRHTWEESKLQRSEYLPLVLILKSECTCKYVRVTSTSAYEAF